ncbi:hypothetical protein ADUPG1_007934, partial [Aduncisulcus paluster]
VETGPFSVGDGSGSYVKLTYSSSELTINQSVSVSGNISATNTLSGSNLDVDTIYLGGATIILHCNSTFTGSFYLDTLDSVETMVSSLPFAVETGPFSVGDGSGSYVKLTYSSSELTINQSVSVSGNISATNTLSGSNLDVDTIYLGGATMTYYTSDIDNDGTADNYVDIDKYLQLYQKLSIDDGSGNNVLLSFDGTTFSSSDPIVIEDSITLNDTSNALTSTLSIYNDSGTARFLSDSPLYLPNTDDKYSTVLTDSSVSMKEGSVFNLEFDGERTYSLPVLGTPITFQDVFSETDSNGDRYKANLYFHGPNDSFMADKKFAFVSSAHHVRKTAFVMGAGSNLAVLASIPEEKLTMATDVVASMPSATQYLSFDFAISLGSTGGAGGDDVYLVDLVSPSGANGFAISQIFFKFSSAEFTSSSTLAYDDATTVTDYQRLSDDYVRAAPQKFSVSMNQTVGTLVFNTKSSIDVNAIVLSDSVSSGGDDISDPITGFSGLVANFIKADIFAFGETTGQAAVLVAKDENELILDHANIFSFEQTQVRFGLFSNASSVNLTQASATYVYDVNDPVNGDYGLDSTNSGNFLSIDQNISLDGGVIMLEGTQTIQSKERTSLVPTTGLASFTYDSMNAFTNSFNVMRLADAEPAFFGMDVVRSTNVGTMADPCESVMNTNLNIRNRCDYTGQSFYAMSVSSSGDHYMQLCVCVVMYSMSTSPPKSTPTVWGAGPIISFNSTDSLKLQNDYIITDT